MFEPDLFRRKIYCIEESRPTCDIFGTFRRTRSDSAPSVVIRRPHCGSAPGELCPPSPPRYTPAVNAILQLSSGDLNIVQPYK